MTGTVSKKPVQHPTKRVASYELEMVPMTADHLQRLAELSVAVRWPQRLGDWQMLLALGEGVVALDEIGRLVGSAMLIDMGGALSHIGMVITAPRLQEQGAGRWLMTEIMRRSEGRSRLLNATKESYRLYLGLGFRPIGEVWQQQGIARVLPGADPRVRSGGPQDSAAIHALDRRAFGADRGPILDYMLPRAEVTVIEGADGPAGFALCRPSGRGHVLGPVVAATEAEAIALIRPLIAAHAGQFLRMDTRHADGALKSALEAAGLVQYDRAMTMSLGPLPHRDPGLATFGLISQAFS